jgi:hypothetical protein
MELLTSKLIVFGAADPLPHWGRQNVQGPTIGKDYAVLPGFVSTACDPSAAGCLRLEGHVHLNRFEIRGREYGVYRDGGPLFDTDARKVRLCDLKLRRLERFTYEYDFGDNWIHDLRIEATLPIDARKSYALCIGGQCSAPPEDSGGAHAFIAKRWQYSAIGRGESRQELDGLVDDDDDEWDLLSRYQPDRFDRCKVNRALARLASGAPTTAFIVSVKSSTRFYAFDPSAARLN